MAGNANSGRRAEKPFADALRMQLKAAGEDHRALRAIAQALIDKAASGDLQAIVALVDRTDGKPIQVGEMNHTASNPLLEFLGRIAAQGQPLVEVDDDEVSQDD